MKRKNNLRVYLSVFAMRLKMETQYRGAAIGGIFCQMFFGLILVALYKALYESRAQSVSLQNVVTYVWLQQAFFRMLLSSDADLADKIRTGAIAYDLCRPMGLYEFYYARIAAQKLMGSLVRAVPMLVLAALLPGGWGIAPPASAAALLCALAALVLGLLCTCAMENIATAFTMRTLDGKGIQALMNLIGMFLTGNLLPLTLFPEAWQRVIGLLPHTQMLDTPIRLYTGEYALSAAPRAWLVQAIWIVLLAVLGKLLWKRNEKKLIVQGG